MTLRGRRAANLVGDLQPLVRPSAAGGRAAIQSKVDEMGMRLESFTHRRLVGRPEFRLRVGDYRVLYEFNVAPGPIYLHYVGHCRDIYQRI